MPSTSLLRTKMNLPQLQSATPWLRLHVIFAAVIAVALPPAKTFGTTPTAPIADTTSKAEPRLRVLFLGDGGHHQPARRAADLMPVLAEHGIDATYTDDVASTLTPDRLAQFDGLIVYANIDRIEDANAAALLQYVADGGGFVPLHCASFCFRNNDDIVALIGAQFQRHGTGVFSVAKTDEGVAHPLLDGYGGFESWDETYVHTKHNERNRTVLEYRTEGDQREPWTWIRTHGNGRVFYTAWGHDERTFHQSGFQNLVVRGIRWACGRDPKAAGNFEAIPDAFASVAMTAANTDVADFEFVDVGPKIPNYVPGKKWGVQEKPKGAMQVPLAPDESIKHYSVPQGFALQLFASEPDLGGKPIAVNWDEAGRLWVAETYDYPNEKQPVGKGRDRIRVCEDTNGDGKADKFTVFAEDLSIPTSLAFSHGGVIVHQAPDTLFLKDTDDDGKADVRQVLFTGWKTNDTHAGPSNLNYGHDNWFYGIVGYAGFSGEIAGRQRDFRTGFYRFKVDTVDGEVRVVDFEFLRNTNNNSWGVGLSEEGLLFGSTANGNPSEHMPIANRFYERVRGWSSSVLSGIAASADFQAITENVRQVDWHGKYTAGAGHALYTARNYPQSYWNRTAFVAGPTGHLVGTFVLKPDGAGFQSENRFNLAASDDEWSAPIIAEVGPDGNVWIVDWYNYIVQHNPTPIGFTKGPGNAYVTDLRDKKHGRVYRLLYTANGNTDRDGPTSLSDATPTDLVAALSSPNMFWRRHAQRLLIERGKLDIAAQLEELVTRENLDGIGLDVGGIHALQTLSALGYFQHANNRGLLHHAYTHASTGVQRTAITITPRDQDGLTHLLRSDLASSATPQLRLAALLALAEMPASSGAAAVIAAALTDPVVMSDTLLTDAATSAAANNAGEFLASVLNGNDAIANPNPDATNSIVAIVAQHLARDREHDVDSRQINLVIEASSGGDSTTVRATIDGLIAGWPKDQPTQLTPEADAALMSLLDSLPAGDRGAVVRLGISLGSENLRANSKRITQSLSETIGDSDATDEQRVRAAAQLIGLAPNDNAAAVTILSSIGPQTSPESASEMIRALLASRAQGLGDAIMANIDRYTPSIRSECLRLMIARPGTTRVLLDAIVARKIAREELSLDQQQALISHPSPPLAIIAKQAFAGAGGIPSPDRARVLASLMHVTENTGDAERGKAVFKKVCANCHLHAGEGAKVGPDLTGMAVHPKAELLTHILDPSRSVEGNFRNYSVLTLDGLVLTGMLASENQTAIELFDAQGKKQTILREDIEQLVASKKSIMPEGFEKQVDEQGLTDLLEFLTAKGAYLPLPIDQAATAISTKGLFHEGDSGADRLIFDQWGTVESGGVPFQVIDPDGKRVRNLILLYGPNGTLPPKMPRTVSVACNTSAKAIHLLSGVSGWGFPAINGESVSMTVRLQYADGTSEDHPLRNAFHFADYIRRVDVPGSEFAFDLQGRQIRRVSVFPKQSTEIKSIDFVKGPDNSSPIVMAVTIETASAKH